MDEERWWRAGRGHDPRFDGWFVVGVLTTGISCRPSCPARTPKRENVRFHASAAAAQAAGLGVRAAARSLGLGEGRALLAHAERWAPCLAYAVQHLWDVGSRPITLVPGREPA